MSWGILSSDYSSKLGFCDFCSPTEQAPSLSIVAAEQRPAAGHLRKSRHGVDVAPPMLAASPIAQQHSESAMWPRSSSLVATHTGLRGFDVRSSSWQTKAASM